MRVVQSITARSHANGKITRAKRAVPLESIRGLGGVLGGGLRSTPPPRGGLPTAPSLASPFPAEVERGRFCLRGGRGQRTAPADVSVVAGLRVWGHGVGMGPGLWLSLSPLT